MSFERILVPVDFSDHSARAVETAQELAKAFSAKLILLHCYQVNPGAVSPYGIVLPEGQPDDPGDVETKAVSRHPMVVEPRHGQPAKPGRLGRGNGLERAAEGIG